MRLRRTAVLLAAVSGLLVGVAGPSFAANNPASYPPGGGGAGPGVVIQLDRTLATVHGTALVTILNCPASSATLTVTGPGRPPGVPTSTYSVAISGGTGSTTVTFDRVGRNTLTADCGGTTATFFETVKAATPAGIKPGSVLGETIQAGSAAAAGAASAVGTLVKTGASTGPLLLAVVFLLAGAVLLLVSRPRRRAAAARASGRHRG